ncbi:MAG: acetylglutamate kinase [Thermoplasmata archaeon]|jgi:acetylglutamate kinase|nr:acetylglutamate kinase [Thermoplasmata archaeon]
MRSSALSQSPVTAPGLRVVLKLGGNVVLDPAQVAVVAAELRALVGRGARVTIVHGGGPQLDKALAGLGEKAEKVDGLRVTSPAAAAVVHQVMDGIGAELADRLRAAGMPVKHVAASPTVLQARLKRAAKGDLGRVGTVERFATSALPLAGVAVVTPVGFDPDGPLNVNADEGAAAVAAALRADWLVLGTDVAAVRGEAGESLGHLDAKGAAALVASGVAKGGMIPKLAAATDALRHGVRNVLIVKVQPGTLVGVLLEGRPEGTRVSPMVSA